MNDVAALILAAGRGSRFGAEPKLLASFEGRPLARHVAEAALASQARPVIAVTGHRAGEVQQTLADLPLQIVPNPSYAEGLSTSLKAGFRALPAGARAAVVLLADMPLVGSSLIDRLVVAWRESGAPPALVPVVQGQRANPVVLSRAIEADIMSLEGDKGAGPLLRARSDVIELVLDDTALLRDVDTVEALAALRS
jgi:molybdenum cofactor cytidylyltransferase